MRKAAIGTLKYAAAILLALWVLVPIYFITLAAFSTEEAVYAFQAAPAARHVDRRCASSSTRGIVPSLQRNVIVAILTLVIALGVGIPPATRSRYAFRGADTFRIAVVGTRAFPIVILSIRSPSSSSAGGSTTRSTASRSRTPRSRCRSPCS